MNRLCFLLLAGMVACNGETEVIEEEEAIRDEVVVADAWDEDEFYTTFSNNAFFEDWDLDNDGFLTEEEFTASFIRTWDLDNDGRISQSEWDAAKLDYGVDAANWTAWDTDGDGYIEEAEFETEFTRIGWYDAWDLDDNAQLTEQEYTTGVFRIWDENNDNRLDETEYVHYNTYYGV